MVDAYGDHVIRARESGRLVSDEVIRYLNWLSDLLYVFARQAAGDIDEPASHE